MIAAASFELGSGSPLSLTSPEPRFMLAPLSEGHKLGSFTGDEPYFLCLGVGLLCSQKTPRVDRPVAEAPRTDVRGMPPGGFNKRENRRIVRADSSGRLAARASRCCR